MRAITKLSVLGGASLLALSAPAFAQDADAADGMAADREEIIVSARRREESIQNVPSVINAVTSEAVAKLNLQTFNEVQSLVPGLQLRNEANGAGASAQVRGVTFDVNSSAQPSVEFYLNDSPIAGTFVLQQMFDIGQIEVQRGPQGTLRGRSSPSGAITVTTRKANLQDIGGYVSASGNDIGTLNFNGAIGVPIIEGVLAVRAAGLWTEGEGNRVRTIDRDLDGRDPYQRTKAGRLSAVFQPADWFKVEGVYQTVRIDSRIYDQYASFSLVDPTAAASPQLIKPSDRLSIAESPRDNAQTFDVYNWRAEGRFAGQVLIYQGQFGDSKLLSLTNTDSANFFNKRDFFQTTDSQSKTKSHEIRLQNEERIADMFDYVVGYLNWKQDSRTSLNQQTPVTLPAFLGGSVATVVNTPILTRSLIKESSIFGNITAHIGDKLKLSGGLRSINLRSPAGTISIGGNVTPTAAKLDAHEWVYAASAQYFFNPDVMAYVGTGTSWRPGPTIVGNFSSVQSNLQRQFTYLKPESSESYELGFKSAFFDRRLRLNVTAYHQKFKNYPYKLTNGVFYQSFSTTGVATVASGAQFAASVPVEVNGLEAEIGLKAFPGFDISVVASYADGKIKKGVVPCDDLNRDGVPDKLSTPPALTTIQEAYGTDFMASCRVTQRSSNQSPFSATVQAEYSHPLSSKVDLFTRGLYSFIGNSLTDPANPYDDLGSYGLLNVYAGVRDPEGMWEVNLFAKNLLDTTRATSFGRPATTGYQELQPPTFRTPAGKTATSTYSIINTTSPREFGVTARFAFGSR